MTQQVLVAVLAALGCAIAGACVPAVIRALPEPPDESDGPDEPDGGGTREAVAAPPPKPLYAVVGSGPALAWWTATVAALLGAAVGYHLGGGWGLLVTLPLVPVGVGVAVVDWTTQTIPVRLMYPTYAVTVATVVVASLAVGEPRRMLWAAIGWAAIGGFYFVMWFVYPPAMGYGDVRLAGVVGLMLGFLGYVPAFVGAFAGTLVGGVGGLVLTLLHLVDRKNLPFGPFILIGAFLGVLVA